LDAVRYDAESACRGDGSENGRAGLAEDPCDLSAVTAT